MNKAPTFEEFWNAYGLKRDRIAAERAWNKLNAKDKRAAIAGIASYTNDCKQRGISRMYGQGYLNHRRWEDDFCAPEAMASHTPPRPQGSVGSDRAAVTTPSPTPSSCKIKEW
ncbi:MAG: hypothetical protein MR924_13630 [Prevotella sp.]|nr:hypothetical protein [Prevotella sp.]